MICTQKPSQTGKFRAVRAQILFWGKKSFLNVPSAYSPERYFSPQNNLCIPACREIIAGLGAYLVPGQKILPERTVCVQSRKIFFTPEQPLHPGLAQITVDNREK